MCVIAMGLTGVASFIPVFGTERIVYWREASALPQPRHTVAYFLGKDLAMLPQVPCNDCASASEDACYDPSSPLCDRPLSCRCCWAHSCLPWLTQR
jgi:hypothetical protein